MKYLKNVTSLSLDASRCTGCGRCAEVCPHEVFVIQDGKARITDRDRCMECGACALNCAFGAIEVTAGVGCAAAVISGILAGVGSSGCSAVGASCCDTRKPSCC